MDNDEYSYTTQEVARACGVSDASLGQNYKAIKDAAKKEGVSISRFMLLAAIGRARK